MNWISVKKLKPEWYVNVLVCSNSMYYEAYFSGEAWFTAENYVYPFFGLELKNVTHWTVLPPKPSLTIEAKS